MAQRTGVIGGTVKFRVRFTGTGYTAGASEKIDIFCTALNTSWTQYSFYINIPNVVPPDWAIDIGIYGANLTAATQVNVDSMTITPVPYWGGVNAQIVAGSTPWVIGDNLSIPISNNDAGVFQTYFGNAYGVQLPTSGSPSISDSLATVIFIGTPSTFARNHIYCTTGSVRRTHGRAAVPGSSEASLSNPGEATVSTGEIVEFTPAHVLSIGKSSQSAVRDGLPIRFPKEHQDYALPFNDPKRKAADVNYNKGFIERYFIEPRPTGLCG